MTSTTLATDRRAHHFDAQIVTHLDDLLHFARSLTRADQDARDLVQETCAKALARSHMFAEGTNMRAWLTTILRNTFVDGWCRERRRRGTVPLLDQDLAIELPADPPRWEEVDSRELWRCVDDLQEPLRTALTLFTVDRLGYEAIAARQGVRPATVGTRILRAKERLRKRLVPAGDN